MILREETRYKVKEKGEELGVSLTLREGTMRSQFDPEGRNNVQGQRKRRGVGIQFDLEGRNNVLSQRE